MENMIRIAVVQPTYSGWSWCEQSRFFREVGMLDGTSGGSYGINRCINTVILEPPVNLVIDVARNYAVRAARHIKADILFTLDADAVPPEGLFKAFVQHLAQHEGVIAAPATTASNVSIPLRLGEELCADVRSLTEVKHEQDLPGTHCLAYSVSVFDKIAKPYYQFTYTDDHCQLTNTEDCHCHARLFNAGVKFWVDGRFWCGHAKTKTLDRPRAIRLN